jgi:hypothetical protein
VLCVCNPGETCNNGVCIGPTIASTTGVTITGTATTTKVTTTEWTTTQPTRTEWTTTEATTTEGITTQPTTTEWTTTQSTTTASTTTPSACINACLTCSTGETQCGENCCSNGCDPSDPSSCYTCGLECTAQTSLCQTAVAAGLSQQLFSIFLTLTTQVTLIDLTTKPDVFSVVGGGLVTPYLQANAVTDLERGVRYMQTCKNLEPGAIPPPQLSFPPCPLGKNVKKKYPKSSNLVITSALRTVAAQYVLAKCKNKNPVASVGTSNYLSGDWMLLMLSRGFRFSNLLIGRNWPMIVLISITRELVFFSTSTL